MSSPSNLFDDALPSSTPEVNGRWCTIRLHPDVVTGEVLNIGVVFAPKRGKTVWRLIHNARGFECLYGSHGSEQYGFLLGLMREHLAQLQKAKDITVMSPQISLGPWRETAGSNADEVVEHLFARMVRINCSEPEKLKTENHSINNNEFRRVVQSQFSPDLKDQIFRKELVSITAPDGKSHYLDMPVWIEKTGFFPHFTYGTLVSCHFKNEVYRKAMLGPACQHMTVAMEHFSKSKGHGFLIALRPEDGTPGFSKEDIMAIENEIDDLTWPFQRHPQVRVHVAHSIAEAAGVIKNVVFG